MLQPVLNTPPAILLVDDEENIQQLVSIALRGAGYEVTVAANGRDALDRLAEATPDLIISDVIMPQLDGFELLAHLRADPLLRAVPVITLTARDTTDDVEMGLGLGADDYITKPFEIRELLARVRTKIARPSVPVDLLSQDRQTGLLTQAVFLAEIERELARAGRGGAPGCLAFLYLDELPILRERLGVRAEAEIARQLTALLTDHQALDLAGREACGRFGLLMPDTSPEAARQRLDQLSRRIVNHAFVAAGERVRLTPIIGYVPFPAGVSAEELRRQALAALEHAQSHLDLQPARFEPAMDAIVARRHAEARAARQARHWLQLVNTIRLPFQIALTLLLSLVLPFFLYAWLDAAGYDVTPVMYLVVVAVLVITAALIWAEGFLSLRHVDPPQPQIPYPAASAIIAAYLPNEAATVLETIEAFLQVTYPGELQIILAYNTPRDLPVEATLRKLAQRDPRFVPLRVPGSSSKAQNINAALAAARGAFIGVFDADHQPHPDSFTRAWGWLADGYDVVQGHCQVRNGDESWVARLTSVEFETIYAVAHPGRARMHGFGIFGGSNGYWKADLIRATRMHGFMLTEDIDSSMRVIEQGYRIAADPCLVSRELGPVTLKALWNQRMRWAQGWFQVSMKHLPRALRSPALSFRQKLGLFHLLGWRELYPWLSPQMFPIIAYWLWRGDALDWFVPVFVLTTLFTLSVGPGQTLFAYLLATPEIRRRKWWFVFHLVLASVFYTEFKNLIARVAVVKELMHERAWKVTPRSGPTLDRQTTDAV